ncbi:hypothetical protein Moror_14585 [Moniliophthora roreri MCA 2997]|uniref:Uncharacterized protein n=2 Tax=Moniliophthora roreri TaxID=221103 RepID=V2X2C6_MONRO|nr:hypothetical protein Moror_14585 [Moniliophthora roreri MCA 2997]KAI3607067.1 hypothetical protein WG66_007877 [Moniliophthora roreri]
MSPKATSEKQVSQDTELVVILNKLEEASSQTQSSLRRSAQLALGIYYRSPQLPAFKALARESCEAVFTVLVAQGRVDDETLAASSKDFRYSNKVHHLQDKLQEIDTFATTFASRSRLATFFRGFSDTSRINDYRKFTQDFILDGDFRPKCPPIKEKKWNKHKFSSNIDDGAMTRQSAILSNRSKLSTARRT